MSRSLSFWSFTLLLAWGSTVLKAKAPSESGIKPNTQPATHSVIAMVPDPMRSTAFSLGFIAIAMTYRRAWLTRRKKITPLDSPSSTAA
jgi:hypothetical protein